MINRSFWKGSGANATGYARPANSAEPVRTGRGRRCSPFHGLTIPQRTTGGPTLSLWTPPRQEHAWIAMLPLCPALDWVVEWQRAFEAGADLRVITRTQIERH